jgi:hypothetical protein
LPAARTFAICAAYDGASKPLPSVALTMTKSDDATHSSRIAAW